jgi:tRNA pseudouridine55 synthase
MGVASALTIESHAGLDDQALDASLLPVDALVADWPKLSLTADDAGRFLSGVRRRLPLADMPRARVYGPGNAFLGTGHVAGGELIATRLLSPAEVAAASATPAPRIQVPESLLS